MNSAEAELERRRERGRLAQSAFRSRQARATQEMRAENARLKDAVEAIVNETCADDRLALRVRIQEAAKLAGLSAGNAETRYWASGWSSNTTSHEYKPAQAETACVGEESDNGGSSSSPNTNSPSIALARPIIGQDRSNYQHSNCISISQDPFQCMRCKDGHETILPFLGAGAFTFAGRMFWHLVERYEAINDDALQSPARTTSPVKFRDLRDHSPTQNVDTIYWTRMIEARLEHYRRAANPQNRPRKIHISDKPASAPNWLSPILAERRIRDIVGDHVFAVLATPMLDRWEMTRGKSYQRGTELIDGLLDKLSESFVCFGDGPRWDAKTLDVAVGEWCQAIFESSANAGYDIRV